MSKTFAWLVIALIALCAAWLWISVRRYAARKRLEEARAAAFMAESVKALRDRKVDTGQNSA